MPNYIRNTLKIEATSEKIEQVFNAIQFDIDSEQAIDFNDDFEPEKNNVGIYMYNLNDRITY